MWFEEYKYFPPGFISPYKYQPATDTTKQTGHFTQMIWAATNQVHTSKRWGNLSKPIPKKNVFVYFSRIN